MPQLDGKVNRLDDSAYGLWGEVNGRNKTSSPVSHGRTSTAQTDVQRLGSASAATLGAFGCRLEVSAWL